jgi:hypothetical protein
MSNRQHPATAADVIGRRAGRAGEPNVAVLGRVPGAEGHYTDLARHPDNRHDDDGISVF